MNQTQNNHFFEKHGADVHPDSGIQDQIRARWKDKQLACAIAFDIARTLDVSAAAVGQNVDLMNARLAKCQLGLFGYSQNKIVKPLKAVSPQLEKAIVAALEDGKLTCRRAWDIAATLDLPKLTISCACENLKIKIKDCQLGAF